MKVAVVGSRQRTDPELVELLVDLLPPDAEVVSGGACGVDTWAVAMAHGCGMKTKVFFGPERGERLSYQEFTQRCYDRNRRIAEYADVVYVFVAPSRKGGTENTIKHAKELRKRVVLIEEMPCPGCGNSPCDCQQRLDAHYACFPEDEPTMCGMCSNTYSAGSLHEGLCERCYYPGLESEVS